MVEVDNAFKGFHKKTVKFLRDLRSNNNKTWFEDNKQDYINHVLKPLQELVSELAPFILSIDPQIEVTPSVNKTISRIYRDTRFSKDKSPYKSSMWITFKRPNKDWKNAPAFFFEIAPDFYRYGMGFYCASKETMDRLRENIDKKSKEFIKAISFLSSQKTYQVEGEKYKRVLDSTKPKELLEWYQRKNLYLVCNRNIDNNLFSGELIDQLICNFGELVPFYYYLWKVRNG